MSQNNDKLEDIVKDSTKKDIIEKTKFKLKSTLVNSITGVIFYTPIMFTYETLIRRYNVNESIEIRAKAAVIGLALYSVYGPFRHLVSYLTKTTKNSSENRKSVVETTSSYMFNVVVYTGILIQNGSKPFDALMTSLGGTVLVGLTGRPYGVVLDKVRKKFELPGVYN